MHSSSENPRPQWPQFGEPLRTDLGLKECSGARELISNFEKKKVQTGNDLSNLSHKPRMRGISHHRFMSKLRNKKNKYRDSKSVKKREGTMENRM